MSPEPRRGSVSRSQQTRANDRASRSVYQAALSRSPRLSAADQVRPDEPDDKSQDGEGKIAVDVLSMVEEVSVNYLVDYYDNHHNQQPDTPVGNEVLPHADSIRFANRFVKPFY
jgi:hypothetical protein